MSNLDERINKNGKIKNINVIFENLEVIVIPADYLTSLIMRDITENFIYTNTSSCYYRCEQLVMTISNKFDMTLIDENYGERNSFQRMINFRDIVAVEVVFENDVTETVYVDWWDACEYENLHQDTEILSDGALLVSIDDYNNDEEKCEFLEADLDGGNDEDE